MHNIKKISLRDSVAETHGGVVGDHSIHKLRRRWLMAASSAAVMLALVGVWQTLSSDDHASIFQSSKSGRSVKPIYEVEFDSTKFKIRDQGLILNLNSSLVASKKPGTSSGDLAILPIKGGPDGAIADGSITTDDIANGAVTINKLAANIKIGTNNVLNLTSIVNQSSGGTISGITTGNGLSGGGQSGNLSLGLDALTSGATSTISSNSGLEVLNDGLRLLGGCSDGQILKWDGAANIWYCTIDNAGAGSLTVRESDGSPSIISPSTLEFGSASSSSDDFIITNQGGGVARVDIGSQIAKLNASQTFSGLNTFSNTSNVFAGNGSGLTALDASNISTGTLSNLRLASSVTVQGNSFNGASQLVQLTSGGILPVLSGANLTNLTFANIAAGTNSGALIIGSGGSLAVSGSGTISATTATALQTSRTINGVSFDGTANITVAAAAGTLTGATLASGVTASSLTSVGTLTGLTVTDPITGSVTGSSGSTTGNAATVTNGVYTTDTGSVTSTMILNGTILAADIASGAVTASKLQSSAADLGAADITVNFSNTNGSFNTNLITDGSITAGSFVGPLTGNATTATALQTSRTINGVSFDGTANITVAAAAGTLTGATLASGVTASSLTSVGTLAGLTVTGTANVNTSGTGVTTIGAVSGTGLVLNDAQWTISDAGAASFVSIAGPLTGNVTGNASGSAATVTGAAQTSITSLGTLTGLTLGGTLSMGAQALTGTTGIIDYTNFDLDATGNLTVAASKGLDTNAAGALQFGKANATSVDICNSAACDTINIGNLSTTDADTITIGDALDTTAINSTGWSISGAGALKIATLSETNLLISNAAPTISSGFGSSPSISANNGTASFRINVGTGGSASSGVIGLPTATTGWNCFVTDITTRSTTVFHTLMTASNTTTATIGNFNTSAAAAAWAASDVLAVSCFAY